MSKQCAKYTKQEHSTKHQNMACDESHPLNSSARPTVRPFNTRPVPRPHSPVSSVRSLLYIFLLLYPVYRVIPG